MSRESPDYQPQKPLVPTALLDPGPNPIKDSMKDPPKDFGKELTEELEKGEESARVNQEAQQNLKKTVDETQVNVRCVYVAVVISFVFVAIFLLVYNAHYVFVISTAVTNKLEHVVWSQNENDFFANINSLSDIDKYVRLVLIPACAGANFMMEENYVLGIRMNLKRMRLVDNPIAKFRDTFPLVWAESQVDYKNSNAAESTGHYGIWDYTYSGSFNNAGAYVFVFIPNQTQDIELSALYDWRLLHLLWLTSETASFVIELLIQNSNLKVTMYYYQAFQMTAMGQIIPSSNMYGILPELFDVWSSTNSWVLFLCIVLLLEILSKIYGAVTAVIRCVLVAIKERRNDLELYEGIGIITLVLEIADVILFSEIFINHLNYLNLPNDQTEFQNLVDQTSNFRSFVRLSTVCILIIVFRAILMLKNEFPSFGILFDTIISARKDIIYFGFISFLLLVAFAVMSYLLFGIQLSEFRTFADCLLTLIVMAIGVTNFDTIEGSNNPLSAAFYIIFELLFLFVLVNMFLAIVMATYTELRRRNQMFIVAKASLLTKEMQELRQRWLNFLLCRRPKGTAIELAKKYVNLKNDQTMESSEKEKLMMDLRSTMLQQTTPSLKDTLKYNMSQLDVFKSIMVVQERTLKTREQYIKELMNEITLINELEKKKREEQLLMESDKAYIYSMIKDMILYTCFIVLFVVMVYFRVRVTDKFMMEEELRSTLTTTKFTYNGQNFTFTGINTPDMSLVWIQQVFFNIAYDDSWAMHHRVIGTDKIRQTLINIRSDNNSCSCSNKVFPQVREPEDAAQEPLNSYSTPSNTANFTGASGHYYAYYSDTRSYRGFGGYVDYWTTDFSNAEAAVARISTDNLLGTKCKALIFDFTGYSGDEQLFFIISVGFMRTEAGGILPQVSSVSFEIDIYTSETAYRAVLEVFFILFLVYYFYRVFTEWYECLKEQRDAWKTYMEEKQLLQQTMDEIKGIENAKKTGSEEVIHCLKRTIDLLVDGSQVFFMASYRYLRKDMFNVLDVVFLGLSIGMIVVIGQILLNDFRRNFSLPRDQGNDNLINLWTLADYEAKYRALASINCLIIFLRMLKNFRFSKRLSVLTEVLDSAALDLIFFAAMFAMILAAYAFMGYALLGHMNGHFNELTVSFMSTYFMLFKNFNASDIIGSDHVLGAVYFISFLVLFQLFLLNMFIAMIVAHFDHIMDLNKDVVHVGLLTTLRKALIEYMKKLGAGRVKALLERCLRMKKEEEQMPTLEDEGSKHDTVDELDEEAVIEPIPMPGTSPNKWIMELEAKLWEKSLHTISFVNFKSKLGAADQRNSLLNLKLDIGAVAFLTKEVWLGERSIKKKIYWWRQLTLMHEAAEIREREMRVVANRVFEPSALTPLQIDLWQSCSTELKLRLWTDPEGFNCQERASIWNIALFKQARLGSGAQEWNLYVQSEILRLYISESEEPAPEHEEDPEDENKPPHLQLFLESFSSGVKRFQRFYRSSQADLILTLLDFDVEERDERLLLWIALSEADKCLLYLSNQDPVEAKLLCYMIFEFVEHHIIRLEIQDKTMSDFLDSKIYDKHMRLAEWQAEQTILRIINERLNSDKADQSSLESYKFFLEKKRQSKEALLEQKQSLLNDLNGALSKDDG